MKTTKRKPVTAPARSKAKRKSVPTFYIGLSPDAAKSLVVAVKEVMRATEKRPDMTIEALRVLTEAAKTPPVTITNCTIQSAK